ncbi:hypothetical protein, partial [Pseudonocardia pini]|uniref:hypothetical protein n=1 Tax=Pseudonocardia pini TaxID=2758030 RepID=UPI001C689A44
MITEPAQPAAVGAAPRAQPTITGSVSPTAATSGASVASRIGDQRTGAPSRGKRGSTRPTHDHWLSASLEEVINGAPPAGRALITEPAHPAAVSAAPRAQPTITG